MGQPLPPRIVFMGSPRFSAVILEGLINKGLKPVAVFTQEDKEGKRGHKLLETEVKKVALHHSIPVFQPRKLRDDEAIKTLKEIEPDFIVVAAYGKILPKSVLEIPKVAPVNVHASILPRWRGASPIQHSILSGDKKTGVSIMRMDEGVDTGPVYQFSRQIDIEDKETATTLTEKLARIGAELLPQTLTSILDRKCEPIEQNDSEATYAPRIKKEDGLIDFSKDSSLIERMTRAFTPWPRCHFFLRGKRITVYESEIGPLTDCNESGILLSSKELLFSCGNGSTIRFIKVQMEGKKT
ncbi:MAG: methionyl-tRNA formyltransferase, partial [Acidobacteria bacterium]|nr:methionyl-tRNA formyltransferase [Acidobacteriota bacterium]